MPLVKRRAWLDIRSILYTRIYLITIIHSSYTPLVTPFTHDEEVDWDALVKQVLRLANARMGIVLLGTNGEGECPY